MRLGVPLEQVVGASEQDEAVIGIYGELGRAVRRKTRLGGEVESGKKEDKVAEFNLRQGLKSEYLK